MGTMNFPRFSVFRRFAAIAQTESIKRKLSLLQLAEELGNVASETSMFLQVIYSLPHGEVPANRPRTAHAGASSCRTQLERAAAWKPEKRQETDMKHITRRWAMQGVLG